MFNEFEGDIRCSSSNLIMKSLFCFVVNRLTRFYSMHIEGGQKLCHD